MSKFQEQFDLYRRKSRGIRTQISNDNSIKEEEINKRKRVRELLQLSSDESEECRITEIWYIIFRGPEDTTDLKYIVTYRNNHTMHEIRNQIVLCLLSSAPRIKSHGVAAWLIDNCGFSSSTNDLGIPSINVSHILKKDCVVNDDDRSITFYVRSKTSLQYTTIHFSLYGDLGLKVYDSIKTLINDFDGDHLVHLSPIPDLDVSIFWNQTRFNRMKEYFESLLNRNNAQWDFSTKQGKVAFLCDCFENLSWFATSFSSGIEINPQEFIASAKKLIQDRPIVRRRYLEYVYAKKRYIDTKKNQPLRVAMQKKREKLISHSIGYKEPHDLKELKFMYKRAKQHYRQAIHYQNDAYRLAIANVMDIDLIHRILLLTTTQPLSEWCRNHSFNIDYLCLS